MKTNNKFEVIRQTIRQDIKAYVIISINTQKRICYFDNENSIKAYEFINKLNKLNING